MIYYLTSDGYKVSEATIKSNLSNAYRLKYEGEPLPCCGGCGGKAQGSSHIISQKRAKQLHKTELIWNPRNFTPACNVCNSRWESNDSTLLNYEDCMKVMREYDPEGYQKRINLIE